jgi:hypothetical protein
MSVWLSLLQRPDDFRDGNSAAAWFDRIAAQMMNGSNLVVNSEPHRLVEVEFYYHGDGHLDPFAHRDPLQLESGRWYFHRTGGVYRSGSFKGLDLTFGDGTNHGGVLIRGIETAAGTLIDGPSLCVDHLPASTGAKNVAALDQLIGGRKAWDATSPLALTPAVPARQDQLLRSSRVGLSLKRAAAASEMPRFVLRPYRYLSEPRRTAKGKLNLVLTLYAHGTAAQEIAALTGSPRASIRRYIEDFEAGRQQTDFTAYLGKDLGPKELSRLHGTWHTLMSRRE